MIVTVYKQKGMSLVKKEGQLVTGGIFYCRDSGYFNVYASNKLSCNLTVNCSGIGNKNIPPNVSGNLNKIKGIAENLKQSKRNKKKEIIMKRNVLLIVTFLMIATIGFSQTATTTTDYFGNKTTTYTNQYGQQTGTAKTTTDYFGNKNTTYSNPYGQQTGTAKTTTDYFGNQNTTFTNPYGQQTGTAKTTTDYFGNKKTTYYDQYGRPIK